MAENAEVDNMRILIVSDIHYAGDASYASASPGIATCDGKKHLEEVLQKHKGSGIDLLAILGDSTDRQEGIDAIRDLEEISAVVKTFPATAIFVRGNHDIAAEKFFSITCSPDYLVVKNYLFFPFHDDFDASGHCVRPAGEWSRFDSAVRSNGEKKIVALQHHVVLPPIDDPYPYNIDRADEVAARYRKANVLLSISGHFHAGSPVVFDGDTAYATAPSLSELPFRYIIMDLEPGIRFDVCSLQQSSQEIQPGIARRNIQRRQDK